MVPRSGELRRFRRGPLAPVTPSLLLLVLYQFVLRPALPSEVHQSDLFFDGCTIRIYHAPLSVKLRLLPQRRVSVMADESAEAKCPVDHKSREAWLKMSQQQSQQHTSDGPQSPPKAPRFTNSRLGKERQVSSIPRAVTEPTAISKPPVDGAVGAVAAEITAHASPSYSANAQSADPHISASGHWIYPSEEMFFNAMRRKQYNPNEKDMSSVIPIHNAVNERTWHEILKWERHQGSFEKCGGPKLVSFSGDASKLTPRARMFSLLGYQPPFDRHDWVVDRCGTKIDYVIDFYQGKGQGGKSPLSFYLDVRPKLNSFEGWRMRFINLFWP